MGDALFPRLEREPVLEEELPAANPAVHLVKGASASVLRPGNQPGCIATRSRPSGS
jgi:hypothetical protein